MIKLTHFSGQQTIIAIKSQDVESLKELSATDTGGGIATRIKLYNSEGDPWTVKEDLETVLNRIHEDEARMKGKL